MRRKGCNWLMRKRYTKPYIEEALLVLLKDHNLDSISVSDVVKKAGADARIGSVFILQAQAIHRAVQRFNARATMGALFRADRVPLSDEECATIFERAYR